MSNPLLTIITINYNNSEGLINTVNSVISQKIDDYSLVEYIIVDGASTDNSVSFLKSLDIKNIPFNINWKSEPDSGIYNAMNKGIKKASGKYLHMLNSGDYLEPNVLNGIINKLKEEPDILLCNLNIWENSEIVKNEIRYPGDLFYGSMQHQGMIYKKDFHDTNGYYDESYRFASDYDFSLKAFYKKNLKIDAIYSPCVNFMAGGVGVSDESLNEIYNIKIKNNILKPKKKNPIKEFIKAFVPYGIIAFKNKW